MLTIAMTFGAEGARDFLVVHPFDSFSRDGWGKARHSALPPRLEGSPAIGVVGPSCSFLKTRWSLRSLENPARLLLHQGFEQFRQHLRIVARAPWLCPHETDCLGQDQQDPSKCHTLLLNRDMRTLWGLQYLRAVAALSVLLFHVVLGSGKHEALGTGGVDIFFVISGFLMFELAAREPSPGEFALARFKRIVPTYWLVTVLVALIQMVGGTEHSSFDLTHLFKSLTFLPDLDVVRGKVYPTLIVGWTLNYEMFFYAVVTGLLLVKGHLRLLILSFLFGALLLIGWALRGQSLALDFYSDSIIIEFVFGAFLSELWRAKKLPELGWAWMVSGAFLLILPKPSNLFRFIEYGIPAFFILLGLLAVEQRRPIVRVFLLKLLGDASYSIYLWHLFVIAAVFRQFGTTPVTFALAITGGVAIGITSYWLIEKPLDVLTRTLTARLRVRTR